MVRYYYKIKGLDNGWLPVKDNDVDTFRNKVKEAQKHLSYTVFIGESHDDEKVNALFYDVFFRFSKDLELFLSSSLKSLNKMITDPYDDEFLCELAMNNEGFKINFVKNFVYLLKKHHVVPGIEIIHDIEELEP